MKLEEMLRQVYLSAKRKDDHKTMAEIVKIMAEKNINTLGEEK